MRKFAPFLSVSGKFVILVFDLIMLMGVFSTVYFARFGAISAENIMTPGLWFIAVLILSSLYIFGTYDLDSGESFYSLFVKNFVASFVGILTIVVWSFLFRVEHAGFFGRGVVLGSLIVFSLLSFVYRSYILNFFNSFREDYNWLLVIEESMLPFFSGDLARKSLLGRVAILTENGGTGGAYPWGELTQFLDRRWSGVISGLSTPRFTEKVGELLVKAKLNGHNVISLTEFYERNWTKVPVYFVGPEWFIAAESFNLVHSKVVLRVKRLIDLALSLVLLIITWPLMLLVYIAVKLESPGPAIYKQVRTGRGGEPFTIFKFRSMCIDAEKNGAQWAQKKDSRITKVGRVIRMTRLDELPQLLNVFKGEMSFIGPRPERPEFNAILEKEIPYYNLRHLVCPGVTGWAQVCYPYGASVEDSREKLQYDLFYIKNYSFFLDIVICLRTIRVILFSKGR